MVKLTAAVCKLGQINCSQQCGSVCANLRTNGRSRLSFCRVVLRYYHYDENTEFSHPLIVGFLNTCAVGGDVSCRVKNLRTEKTNNKINTVYNEKLLCEN